MANNIRRIKLTPVTAKLHIGFISRTGKTKRVRAYTVFVVHHQWMSVVLLQTTHRTGIKTSMGTGGHMADKFLAVPLQCPHDNCFYIMAVTA